MSVIEAFKHITSKINSMVKDMDNKLDTFSEEILNIMTEFNPEFFSNSDDIEKDKELLKQKVKGVFNVFKPEKKPLNGYMIYCKENRERLVSENPECKLPEVTKLLSKEWNELEDNEKNKYRSKSVKPSIESKKEDKKRGRSKSKKPSTDSKQESKKEDKKEVKKEESKTNKSLLLEKIKQTEKKAKEYERTLTPKSVKSSPHELIKAKPKPYSKNKSYWSTTPTTIKGKKMNLHKETGLILNNKDVVGMYLYDEFIAPDDIDEDMKEWARMCEFNIEGDDELTVELDEEDDE